MTIVPQEEAEFGGVYFAHCPDERIEVEVDKWLGIAIRHESWLPTFPAGFVVPAPERLLESMPSTANCLAFYIRFVGTPGDPDICGYLGCCQRRVTVRQVLALKELGSTWG